MTKLPKPEQNQLLSTLPTEVFDRLLPRLELVPLPLGLVLYESGDTLRHVYFPTDSSVSLLSVTENGSTAEISVVGNEGIIGAGLLMGEESTSGRAIVQDAGHAYRLLGQTFKDECRRHADLLLLKLRCTQALITQMAQTALCERNHSINQQLCRWLLLSLDRLSDNQLRVTQELITNMLGERCEGVTMAASKLHKLGVIEYSNEHITVPDKPKLEARCCEGHAVGMEENNSMLPYFPSAG